MDLFSMGVIDDADRPRQHRPLPVRCFESELLPLVPKVPRCYNCHNFAIEGNTICTVCQRKGQLRAKCRRQTKPLEEKQAARLRASLICRGGVLAENIRNRKVLAAFVAAGGARWGTPRDLRRLGLGEDARVAILMDAPE